VDNGQLWTEGKRQSMSQIPQEVKILLEEHNNKLACPGRAW